MVKAAAKSATVISLLVLLWACTGTQVAVNEVFVEMKPELAEDESFLAELLDVERVVPLKTDKLTGIDKIVYKKKRFYAMDGAQRQIMVFDMDGNAMSAIRKLGKAKYEYLSITDFDVDDNGDIMVFDSQSAKVLRYSYSGDFKGMAKVGHGDEMLLTKGKSIVIKNIMPDKVRMATYSLAGDMLGSADYQFQRKPINLTYTNGMAERKDSILFTLPLDYNLYSLYNNVVTPVCRFDFSDYNLSDDILDGKNKKKAIKYLSNAKGVLYLKCMGEYGGLLFLATNSSTQVLYSIGSGKVYVTGNLRMPISLLFTGPLSVSADGYALTAITPENMSNGLAKVADRYRPDYPFIPSNNELKMHKDAFWVVLNKLTLDRLPQ